MEAAAHKAEQSLSVDEIRLLVMRPPLPISDAQVKELTTGLVARFQSISQSQDDAGAWYFSTANANAGVALTRDRLQFTVSANMDSEIALATIFRPMATAIRALDMTPPFPYGVAFEGTFDSATANSIKDFNELAPAFERLLPAGATTMGNGLRQVYKIGERLFDWRIESLFVNPKRFYVVLDINSLSIPAVSAEELEADVRKLHSAFVESYVPMIASVLSGEENA